MFWCFFFFNDTATTEIYTLSLHDALPIYNQSRVLERVLRERRIPYFLSGGTSFFDKTEIKDVMAYLRLLCNPGDDNAFLRVVNTPRREIGPATLEQLAAHAAELNTSLLQASMDPGIDTKLTARQETSLRSFTHWLMEMITKSEDEEPDKIGRAHV